MDYYLQALQAIQFILHNETSDTCFEHWANWLEKDINDWISMQSTRHHISAYGGMGSFNDLPPMKESKATYKIIFPFLKSFCYSFASMYGRRNMSIEALQKECLEDLFQDCLACHKKINQLIINYLQESSLVLNIDKI